MCTRRAADCRATSRARSATSRSANSLRLDPELRRARRAIASAYLGYNTLADAANGVLEVNHCFANKASEQAYRPAGDTPSTWWPTTMLLPDGLDYEQAAPLFCAGYTVWSGLRWAEPQPGERVAVVGIIFLSCRCSSSVSFGNCSRISLKLIADVNFILIAPFRKAVYPRRQFPILRGQSG